VPPGGLLFGICAIKDSDRGVGMFKLNPNQLKSLFVTSLIVSTFVIGNHLRNNHRSEYYFSPDKITFKGSESLPMATNCADMSTGELSYQSEVIILDSFARHLGEGFAKIAATAQWQYAMGYFNLDPSARNDTRVLMLAGSEIEVIDKTQIPYPASISIDWLPDDKKKYPLRFHQSTRVFAGERSWRIRYRSKFSVLLCGKPTSMLVHMKLPVDPYLAYWYVPAADRVETTYKTKTGKVNPCANPQMLDLEAPSHYWYAWSPSERGTCRRLLKKNLRDVAARFTQGIVTSSPVSFSHLASVPQLRMDLIWGFMNNKKSLLAQVEESKSLISEYGSYGFEPSIGEIAQIRKKLPGLEPSAWLAVEQIRHFKGLTKNFLFKVNSTPLSHVITAEGILLQTDKPVVLRLFIGSTDEASGNATHWEFLRRGLVESDVIFYVGHAGMGLNMNLDRFVLSGEMRARPYQFLGIVSCYSTNYFGRDFLNNRKGLESHLLRVGTGKYPYLIPMAVLSFIDAYLAGLPVSLDRALARTLAPEEVVLFERGIRN
jgi:hypothetical protein